MVHPSRPHAERLLYNSITMSCIAVDVDKHMVLRTSRVVHMADDDLHSVRSECVKERWRDGGERSPFFLNSLSTVRILICHPRAVSRTLLVLRLISSTCWRSCRVW